MNEWLVKYWNGNGISAQVVSSDFFNLTNAILMSGIPTHSITSIERKVSVIGEI